jgi:quinol monooxygenase YgiN
MSVHVVIATFNFKSVETKAKFLEVLHSDNGLVKTRACEGCRSIDCCESNTNELQVVIFQKWDKQENHEAYLQMRKESGLFDVLETLLAEPLDVKRFTLRDV